jgi:hypothetical protein
MKTLKLGFGLICLVILASNIVPIAMLSVWSVSFAALMQPAEATEGVTLCHEPASFGTRPQ